jgi:hypothetical protein
MAVPDLTAGSCQPGNHRKLSPDAWLEAIGVEMRREVVRACQACVCLAACRKWVLGEMPEAPGHAAADYIIMAGMTRAEREAARRERKREDARLRGDPPSRMPRSEIRTAVRRELLRNPGRSNAAIAVAVCCDPSTVARGRRELQAGLVASTGLASAAATVPPAAVAVAAHAGLASAAAGVPPVAVAVAAHAGFASAAATVPPARAQAVPASMQRAMAALLRDHRRPGRVIAAEAHTSGSCALRARRELEDAGLIGRYRGTGGRPGPLPIPRPAPLRQAVTMALTADPARSNREIARQAGVSDMTVGEARHALEDAGAIPVWRHPFTPRRPSAAVAVAAHAGLASAAATAPSPAAAVADGRPCECGCGTWFVPQSRARQAQRFVNGTHRACQCCRRCARARA